MTTLTEYKKEHKEDFGREKIDVLYEDENLCVIYKPEGMLSVPYPGSHNRTAIEALELIMRKKGTYSAKHRPFVVHRLDRDTSGVMMFALNEGAQKKIMDSWHKMVTRRLYHAVAENPSNGKELPVEGLIDDEIAYNAHNIGFVPKPQDKPSDTKQTREALRNKNRTHADGEGPSIFERNLTVRNGKAEFKTITARTHYKILERGKKWSLFELSLDTGRKNQIRAHLASKGYPLAGDENYRAKTNPFGRLALHARTLEFDHPYTGKHLEFEVKESDDWLLCVQGKLKGRNIDMVYEKNGGQKKHLQKQIDIQKEIAARPTKKQLSKMNFIQQGQAKKR